MRLVRMRRVCMRLARGLGGAASALALGLFRRALLGQAPRVFLRPLARLFLFDTAPILRLEPLALAPVGLGLLALGALRLFGFALLRVELLLLGALVTFEHIALDVGALAPHFDVDGAGASLIAGQLQLALGLALESDAARGRALTTLSLA